MKQLLSFVLPFGFLLAGCGPQNSPLSDIKLTDPSVLAPSIRLVQHIDEDGRESGSIEVWLYDKNGNTVELKDGGVRVNGKDMKVRQVQFTEAPYYSADRIIRDLEPGTTYDFEIILADGKAYKASIKTPEEKLDLLRVPDRHNRNEDMVISWEGIHGYDEMTVKLACYYDRDESQGIKTEDLNIPARFVTQGEFTIGRENFRLNEGEIYKAKVTVSGVQSGEIDKQFAPGSEISCRYSIEQEIKLDE
ncbi:MAG: hypothetical protein JW801_08035 [Bacteroidales bacterium]|nr:hypothetical protein [Bacteroidales bacterium]